MNRRNSTSNLVTNIATSETNNAETASKPNHFDNSTMRTEDSKQRNPKKEKRIKLIKKSFRASSGSDFVDKIKYYSPNKNNVVQ